MVFVISEDDKADKKEQEIFTPIMLLPRGGVSGEQLLAATSGRRDFGEYRLGLVRRYI